MASVEKSAISQVSYDYERAFLSELFTARHRWINQLENIDIN